MKPKTNPRSNLIARTILFVAFGCLIGLIIGVIWVLPEFVDEVPLPEADVAVTETKPAPPNAAQTKLARQKREAERALQEFLHRQAVLESEEVATWGGEEYEQALATLAEADAAFSNGDFTLANTKYLSASSLLNELAASKAQRLRLALSLGARALSEYDAEVAKKQYEIALALEPQNEQALMGSKRANNIEQLAQLLAQANELEQSGDWSAALKVYNNATALDPQSDEARQGLQRAETELAAQRFRSLMSTALAAIQNQNFTAATEALTEANKLKPQSADVQDAKKRLQLAVQEQRISVHRQKAKTLVDAERWHEAAKEYDAVLNIDSQAQFASRGLSQSRRLAKLHDQLDSYIRHPERLQSLEPRSNAHSLIDVLASMPDKKPILTQKHQQLIKLLKLAETPVKLLLRSNEVTEVSIDRIGRFGRFKEFALTLLPGDYIARGTRIGYRDVRLEFSIVPGDSLPTVIVQCEEKI